jgi:hypothetical protein
MDIVANTGIAGNAFKKDSGSILQRYFELINLYPKISSPDLEKRIEHFTLTASTDEMYTVQETFFREGAPYLLEDSRMRRVMEILDGKSIGLAIGKEYQTTVRLQNMVFSIERGIKDKKNPVFSVSTRKDYVDALLRRKDPLKLVLSRKLTASHKITLAKWGLPFIDVLLDTSMIGKVLNHQPIVESVISDTLLNLGY